LIQRLLLGSGGEHCDLELAVEVRRGAEEGGRRKEGGGQADIKSNNPQNRWGKITYRHPWAMDPVCLGLFIRCP